MQSRALRAALTNYKVRGQSAPASRVPRTADNYARGPGGGIAQLGIRALRKHKNERNYLHANAFRKLEDAKPSINGSQLSFGQRG
jgi:hypothetical protein